MINLVHQPLYVHCLNGAEVTSLIIGCLRKLQCWSVSSTMAEFGRYCLVRPAHTSFIETFHVEIEVLPKALDQVLIYRSQRLVHGGCSEGLDRWGRRGLLRNTLR